MFYAAFENEESDGYLTEKIWGSLASGTLPIFYGAKDVKDYMPDPKSIIVVNDFDNLTALEHHIRYLIRNRSAYMEYFSWKRKPLSKYFKKKWNFAHVHSACRVCRWVTAKRLGLDWDKEQQDIVYAKNASP